MSSSSKKKGDDKFLKILREMVTYEGNRYCFDCNQRGPTYVNITIGSFVCTSCGGALRKYSHRVKSISMSNFTQAEMDILKKRGNDMCRKIYFGLCDRSFTDVKNDKLDDLLRQKYELKKWYLEPTREQEEETEKQNQELFDRVEKPNQHRTGQRPMVNAAAGLIVQPPKPLASISRTSPANTNSVTTNGDLKSNHSQPQAPNPQTFTPAKSNNLIDDFGGDPFGMANDFSSKPVSEPQTSLDFLSSVVVSGPPQPSLIQPQSSQPISINQTTYNKPAPPTSSVDKYAALAELDAELFSSAATSSTPSTGLYNSPPRGNVSHYGFNSPHNMQPGLFPTSGLSASMSASAGWPAANQQVTPGWPSMPPTAPVSTGGWVNPFSGQSIKSTDSPSIMANPFVGQQSIGVSQPSQSVANPFTSWSQNTVNTNTSGFNGSISSSGWNANFSGGVSGANPFAAPSNNTPTINNSQLPANGNSGSRNPFL